MRKIVLPLSARKIRKQGEREAICRFIADELAKILAAERTFAPEDGPGQSGRARHILAGLQEAIHALEDAYDFF